MSSSLYHYSWDQCEIILRIFKTINETDKKWLCGFNFLIISMPQIKGIHQDTSLKTCQSYSSGIMW